MCYESVDQVDKKNSQSNAGSMCREGEKNHLPAATAAGCIIAARQREKLQSIVHMV